MNFITIAELRFQRRIRPTLGSAGVDIEDLAEGSKDGYDRRRLRRKARNHTDMVMQMEAG